jgi:hypothetical protein
LRQPNEPKPNSPEEYQAWGVDPPEHIPHLKAEELEEKLKSQFGRGHIWKQQGPYIFCDTCPFKHGANIPINYILQGTNSQGKPYFKDLDTGNIIGQD